VVLNVLDVYNKSKLEMTEGAVAAFHKLTAYILEAKYATAHSSYVFPTPDEVRTRDSTVRERWAHLDTLYAAKLAVFKDDLAREEFRERLALSNEQHVNQHVALKAWIEEKVTYLTKKEAIESVRDSRAALNLIDIYSKAK